MKKYFYLMCLLFVFLSCVHSKDGHFSFSFVNDSDKGIYMLYTEHYPDTLWYCSSYNGGGVIPYLLESKKEDIYGLRLTIEEEFERLRKKGVDFLQLFIVDSVIYKTKPCDTIREKNLILKRYQINIDTLVRYNWVIPYP